MGLQLSGSINVTGSFNTTAPGVYSGSGLYTSMIVSGSLEDSEGNPGAEGMIFSVDKNSKAKWITGDSIEPENGVVNPNIFDYSIEWGGASNGLQFTCSAASLPLFGVNYTISETILDLDAADPSNPRFDIIVATTQSDSAATFNIIKGTPAVSPFYPNYNFNNQLPLKYVLVRAASTSAADGGDGDSTNGDGTNGNTDDTDSYPNYESRVIWAGTTTPSVHWEYNHQKTLTTPFSQRLTQRVFGANTAENYPGTDPGSFRIGLRAIANGYYLGYGNQVKEFYFERLRCQNTSNQTIQGPIRLELLSSFSFYIKLTRELPANLTPSFTTYFIQGQQADSIRYSYYAFTNLENTDLPTVSSEGNGAISFTNISDWQKIVIPKTNIIKPSHLQSVSGNCQQISIAMLLTQGGRIPYYNQSLNINQMKTYSTSEYIYFDKFEAQMLGSDAMSLPTTNFSVLTPSDPLPAYNISYKN